MGCGSTKAVSTAVPPQQPPAVTPPAAQQHPNQQTTPQAGAQPATGHQQPQQQGTPAKPGTLQQAGGVQGPKYLSMVQELLHSERKGATTASGIDILVDLLTPAGTTSHPQKASNNHTNQQQKADELPKSIDVLAEMAAETPEKPYHGIRMLNEVQKSAA